LIPTDPHFRPNLEGIADFLEGAIELGVVPHASVSFNPVKRVRARIFRGRNPFTGETLVFRAPTRMAVQTKVLKRTEQILPAARGVAEFDVRASGVGLPRTPPVPIDFSKPYTVDVGCCVRSRLVSLSDLHEESGSKRKRVPFGERCKKGDSIGLYSNPKTLEVIEVPGAGCGRFWIEFELGKFLFPKIKRGNLRILNPRITKLAERCFVQEFLQGCSWG
jgi:hypothetical protein